MRKLKPVFSFAIAACVSLALAFLCFDVSTLELWVQLFGLGVLCVLVIASCYWGARALQLEGREVCRKRRLQWWARGGRWDVLFVCVVSLCVHLQEPHEYKVLMDEIVLLNTSRAIYETQQVYAPKCLDFMHGGFELSREGYIDKRPYFFPFAVSILHFLTGYRYSNGFLLNILLTPVLFGLMLALVRVYVARPLVGYAAVMLFVSLPVVPQVATSSGAEWLNATLVLLLAWSAIWFAKRPCLERMQFMFATVCVLAYTRYESIAYIFAACGVWAMVCWRERRVFLSYATCLYPVVLIPLVWIMRIVHSNESAYFQHEMLGSDVTFSMSYFTENLHNFARFFLELQPLSLNAPVTTGLLLVVCMICVHRMLAVSGGGESRTAFLPVLWSPLLWLGLVACGCMGLLLFYLWGDLNDPVVTRIALPFLMLWIVFAVTLWGVGFSARVTATPVCCVLFVCLWFGSFSKGEALAARTNLPVVQHALAGEWIREELGLRDVVFSWNTSLFLPYRVIVFPESNLFTAFDRVYEMRSKGLINRVFVYFDPAHSKPVVGDQSPYRQFLEQEGEIHSVRSRNVGIDHTMQLFELDFGGYRMELAE